MLIMKEEDIDNNCIRLGRGQTNYNHAGNRKFRDLVSARVAVYKTCKKPQKTEIVDEVTQKISEEGMRFIELKGDVWIPLTNEDEIRKKVAHRFRDAIEAERKAEQEVEPMEEYPGMHSMCNDGLGSSKQGFVPSSQNASSFVRSILGDPFADPASSGTGCHANNDHLLSAASYPSLASSATDFFAQVRLIHEMSNSSTDRSVNSHHCLQSPLHQSGQQGAEAHEGMQNQTAYPPTAASFMSNVDNNRQRPMKSLEISDGHTFEAHFSTSGGIGNEALANVLNQLDILLEVANINADDHQPSEASNLKSEPKT